MKRFVFTFIFIWIALYSFSQISEGKSGIKQFNISKKGTDQNNYPGNNRAPNDITAPVITLQSPELTPDSISKTTSKMLMVKGKVEDTGGIFEVIVNGMEAKVTSEGVFFAEIPQAFGTNLVTIKATDISFNKTELKFYSERLTDQLSNQYKTPINSTNSYSIDLISPSSEN